MREKLTSNACCSILVTNLSVLHLESLPDPVDLLVDLSPVVVALLTSPGHGGLDPTGMPGSDTGNLPQTLVSLPGQLLGVPPAGDALEPVALGHADDVHHLVLGEHGSHGDLLLEVVPGKVDLVGDGTAIELDLHDVSFLLPKEDLY